MNYRMCVLLSLIVTFYGCGSNRDSDGRKLPEIKFHFKAILINNELYLKTLFNESDPFGPFKLDKYGRRYVYYPNPKKLKFQNAMQIFKEKTYGMWVYYDNNVSMAGMNVDPNGVLK